MSFQHRTLGYRPPPGSLAARAQAAVQHRSKSLCGTSDMNPSLDENFLKKAANCDAAKIKCVLHLPLVICRLTCPRWNRDLQTKNSQDTTNVQQNRSDAIPQSTSSSESSHRRSSAKARKRSWRHRRGRSRKKSPSSAASQLASNAHSCDRSSSLTPSTARGSPPPMLRAETEDSVEIIGDILMTRV